MMKLPEKINVLTRGHLSAEFAAGMAEHPISYGLNVRRCDQILPEDLEWAYCFAGFPPSGKVDFTGLKWIHCFGAGVDGFLSRHIIPDDCILTKTIGGMGRKMGEYCLCHVLARCLNYDVYLKNKKEKLWKPDKIRSLQGRKVLILGTGAIASEVARMFTAIGCAVTGVNSRGWANDAFCEIYSFDNIPEDLREFDIVINLLPLTNRTRGIIGNSFFRRLYGVHFINTGRGATVVTEDLIRALDEGLLSFATLDVFEEEPLPQLSPLWEREDIFITPHVAAVTTADDVITEFAAAYEAIKSGRANSNFVHLSEGY